MASSEARLIGMIASLTGRNTKAGPSVSNDCRNCVHRRTVPGNSHIACDNPDPHMTGDPHGVRNGWFMYPILFDPTWMTAKCSNFESVNPAGKSSGKPE